jgi:hypothetical protein
MVHIPNRSTWYLGACNTISDGCVIFAKIYQQEIVDVEIKSEPKRQQSIYGKGLQFTTAMHA